MQQSKSSNVNGEATENHDSSPQISSYKSGEDLAQSRKRRSSSPSDYLIRERSSRKPKPPPSNDEWPPPPRQIPQLPQRRQVDHNILRQVFQTWDWTCPPDTQPSDNLDLVETLLYDMTQGSWVEVGEEYRESDITGNIYWKLATTIGPCGYRTFSNGSTNTTFEIYPGLNAQELPDWLPLAHLGISNENPFAFVTEGGDWNAEGTVRRKRPLKK